MNRIQKIALMIAALAFAVVPLLSQTNQAKPTFEVVSIKPSAPNLGIRGGGPRGDRFSMTGVTLKMLMQIAYARPNTNGAPGNQTQIMGGPNWIDADRYDIEAKADCSGGVISREQLQLMIQSMLEDRFQLKAHKETRELPVYHLVVAKDGAKLKASEDQTPPSLGPAAPPQPCGPTPNTPPPLPPPGQRGGALPRGALRMMLNAGSMTLESSAISIPGIV